MNPSNGRNVAQENKISSESLIKRHRAASMVVSGIFVLTILLLAIVNLGRAAFDSPRMKDPALAAGLWIAILVFGLGAVVYRRTKFSPMRLQAIAGLRGTDGLLAALQRTTIMVALLGGVIALMGFTSAYLMGEPTDMNYAGVIAIAVLLYCYPRRAAWQRAVEELQPAGTENFPPAKGETA